ncbi:MAG: Mov34/MPN/PAD-1 family protein [Candidatus Margulisbacteria bacterium]|nr:Mov34/MPN/PAD-1 family protein [Candidatus Margulisiibacteriota bacterium]
MDEFSITQRHYEIIIDQVKKNFPYESGGFVGGKNGLISAIYPVYNQDISNKTDIFAVSRDDIERAHLFFNKHALDYYGTYHSHPKGAAIPSKQDLSHIQKYLFIISLASFDQPDFAAFKVTGVQQAKRIPLNVVSNDQFSVKDIHAKTNKATNDGQEKDATPDFNNTDILNEQINNVFSDQATYKRKSQQNNGPGDFSTLA